MHHIGLVLRNYFWFRFASLSLSAVQLPTPDLCCVSSGAQQPSSTGSRSRLEPLTFAMAEGPRSDTLQSQGLHFSSGWLGEAGRGLG